MKTNSDSKYYAIICVKDGTRYFYHPDQHAWMQLVYVYREKPKKIPKHGILVQYPSTDKAHDE